MKYLFVIIVQLLAACGGSLSDDQRKKMRQRMEDNKIVRVTDVEITERGLQMGKAIADSLERLLPDSASARTFINRYPGQIRFVSIAEAPSHPLERQVLDAFRAAETGLLQDNLQRARNTSGDFDSLLYTHPVMSEQGALLGVWNIWFSKKQVVQDIGRQR